MQCQKCKHPLSDESVTCIYCGEPKHSGAVVSEKSAELSVEDMGGEAVSDTSAELSIEDMGGEAVSDTSAELSIEDMVMHTMEPVKGERKGVCKEDNSAADPLSLKKTAAMLAKMKGLLDDGRFDIDVYERVALDSIKDYLTTLNEGAQLIFVSYEIGDSKLAPFLTEDMIEKIKIFVTDTISER